MSRLQHYRLAAYPFVTRSLRGGRLRRYSLVAGLLALLTLLLGTWVALGPGDFEREMRVTLDLEKSRNYREHREYMMFARDAEEAARLTRAREKILTTHQAQFNIPHDQREWELEDNIENAANFVASAIQTPCTAKDQQLRDRALSLRQRPILQAREGRHFDWESGRTRLGLLLDRKLAPKIEVYASPLTAIEAVRISGMLAGCFLIAFFLVFAPLIAGTQLAQEAHENTLMPLTGTALRRRELVVGLFAGPLTVISILALPQAVVFLVAAGLTGIMLPALGLLVVLGVACMMLGMLTQLVGLAVGRVRTPGIVGVALVALLSLLTVIGATIGLNMRPDFTGLLALLPEAASFHLLRSSMMPEPLLTVSQAASADTNLVIGTLGIGLLALLGFRALERRIDDCRPSSLTAIEAALGALISTVLIEVAIPSHNDLYYFYTLLISSVPFVILLMMRVPTGGTPPALRQVPVVALLSEFLGYYALHLAVTAVMLDEITLATLNLEHAATGLYLAIFVATAGLFAIRLVAQPLTTGSRIWLGITGLLLAFEFFHVLAWATNGYRMGYEDVIFLYTVSPFLGVVLAILTVLAPVLLVRGIRPRA
ncbi:MAG: hypothetical protein ACPG4T_09465 [Nannocystaceae bacterium]